MPVNYNEQTKTITIETDNTLYAMKIEHDKYLTHLCYRERGFDPSGITQLPARGFSTSPSDLIHFAWDSRFSADVQLTEYSQFDSGDYRTEAIRVKNPNGDSVTLFEYISHEVIEGRCDIPGMPFASADKDTETLKINMYDKVSCCTLELYYTVFPREDVISRYFRITNNGTEASVLESGASICLDIADSSFDLVSFYGFHARERMMTRSPLTHTKTVMESRRGATSHHMNNSFALVDNSATETEGRAYGFSFVYSGNFRNSVEVDQNSSTRVIVGLNPDFFSWKLEPGDTFCSPEAVMTYSHDGIGKMSRNLHTFARRHIVRPCNTERRPVVLNTWEGNFFDIDEDKMIAYAKDAAACGFDMLVMDDGWFGKRINDRAGLGDWYANPDRFKNGLGSFVRRIKENGIRFGIWIEPEMVNPDSDLYRAHPEWALHAPERSPSLSRMQLVLDFTNPEVLEYLKKSFTETFRDVPIDYIKWDFNRHLAEAASKCVPADRQREVTHRFMLGVYELYQWFCDTYPNVMIENCSGGGGRYDLGMMKYSSMIWTSDNTIPDRRVLIQYGSSIMYPTCVMSCHVANHEGSVENDKLLDYGYKIALQGMLGYEFDITKVSDEAKATIKRQISDYRRYQHIIENGDLYRLMSPFDDGKSAFYYISEDKDEILVFFYQLNGEEPHEYRLKIDVPKGTKWIATLDNDRVYSAEDLNMGFVAKNSETDRYAAMFHFVLVKE